MADIDTNFLAYGLIRDPLFKTFADGYQNVGFSTEETDKALERVYAKLPFVPGDYKTRCHEVMTMQVAGLAGRLRYTGIKSVTVALSGGLDSALALLVAVNTFDALGLERRNIHTVSMPGFGSSKRTKSNAQKLAEGLGVSFREIPITEAVSLHFKDIGHSPGVHDFVYENAQARERTQIAMSIATQTGGLMLGPGCLSELALGFTTYGGDHMSMYSVNASVPKTLLRFMVKALAETMPKVADVLLDILTTPVSPELLPEDPSGKTQETEKIVGPYELHDFFLYHMLRRGAEPEKVMYLAEHTFSGLYDAETIKKWHGLFYTKFFANQFKRSCLPDGPKVGPVCLSPREGFKMPSDVKCIDCK
jgi:NAD+ synthase (glutamine-hydrolysing)